MYQRNINVITNLMTVSRQGGSEVKKVFITPDVSNGDEETSGKIEKDVYLSRT